MKILANSCRPPILAIFLQLQYFLLAGSATLHKRKPSAGGEGQLRAALASKSEELNNQKNIAHGLELEVSELQSELQADKKALTVEKDKENSLQTKLNKVRAALEDSTGAGALMTAKATEAKMGKVATAVSPAVASAIAPAVPAVAAPAVHAMPVPDGDADVVARAAARPAAFPLAEGVEAALDESQVQAVEALPNVPDSELEPAVDGASQQTFHTPPPYEEAAASHSSQQSPQEPSSFSDSSSTAPVASPKVAAKPAAMTSIKMKANSEHVAKAEKGVRRVPKPVQTSSPHAAVQPVMKAVRTQAAHPSFRGTGAPAAKAVAVAVAKAARASANPVAPTAMALPAASPGSSSEAGMVAAPSADFDALEAQLHEEDRRIQDLDRESALDAMTEGGAPSAAAQSATAERPPLKSLPGQPKLDMEAMPAGDFLNVESPAPDSAVEAPTSLDAPMGDASAALPAATVASDEGLDSALSDNQFLSQIAPATRRG